MVIFSTCLIPEIKMEFPIHLEAHQKFLDIQVFQVPQSLTPLLMLIVFLIHTQHVQEATSSLINLFFGWAHAWRDHQFMI